MSNVIEKIERGELTVQVYEPLGYKSEHMCVPKARTELLRLARMGVAAEKNWQKEIQSWIKTACGGVYGEGKCNERVLQCRCSEFCRVRAGVKIELPPDKVIIHKDRITEYETRIAELKRQADELYPIMKFEQERANRAVCVLREIEATIKPMRICFPVHRLLDIEKVALLRVYSLAQKGLND